MSVLYPIERTAPVFPLWALAKMLILFAMLPADKRQATFYRLQTLLTTTGMLTPRNPSSGRKYETV